MGPANEFPSHLSDHTLSIEPRSTLGSVLPRVFYFRFLNLELAETFFPWLNCSLAHFYPSGCRVTHGLASYPPRYGGSSLAALRPLILSTLFKSSFLPRHGGFSQL